MEKKLKLSSNCILHKGGTRDRDPHDQISQLPDELLVSILSILTPIESAATSVLSRRWEHLWKLTTRLNFDVNKLLERMVEHEQLIGQKRRKLIKCRIDQFRILQNFELFDRTKHIKCINKVLKVHSCSMLEEFRVCFCLGEQYKNDIDNWLNFAFARRVQRLELDLRHHRAGFHRFRKIYHFPSELVIQRDSPPLREPCHGSLLSCNIVGLTSLKELILKRVNVSGEVLESFLSNCPHLERLVVCESWQLVKFDVCGTSLMLRFLEISSCRNLESIKICNTNLVSFKYTGALQKGELLLDNLPLLVEVFIGLNPVVSIFAKLSSVLPQLENLTLWIDNIEERMELQGFPELSRLKQLVLVSEALKTTSPLGVASLINLCPLLHKFVLKCGTRDRDPHDQISQLPDEVLVSILSILTPIEAAATSVLSKRWEHLWKLTTRLNFDVNKLLERMVEHERLNGQKRRKLIKCRIDQYRILQNLELFDRTKNINCINKVLKQEWTMPSRKIEEKPKKAPKCPHHNLKAVELAGYYGRSSDLELAMYFLKNAVELEKLIIDPRDQGKWDRYTVEEEENARTLAKQQLEGVVPPHVSLEIL